MLLGVYIISDPLLCLDIDVVLKLFRGKILQFYEAFTFFTLFT